MRWYRFALVVRTVVVVGWLLGVVSWLVLEVKVGDTYIDILRGLFFWTGGVVKRKEEGSHVSSMALLYGLFRRVADRWVTNPLIRSLLGEMVQSMPRREMNVWKYAPIEVNRRDGADNHLSVTLAKSYVSVRLSHARDVPDPLQRHNAIFYPNIHNLGS